MNRRHTDRDYMAAAVNWSLLIALGLFWYAVYQAYQAVFS